MAVVRRSCLGPNYSSPGAAGTLLVFILCGMATTVSLASIATGNGMRLRPARSVVAYDDGDDDGQHDEGSAEYQVEPAGEALEKRSMTLGRLSFRPGKRWTLPVPGAYAHDRQNGRYNLLLIGDHHQQSFGFTPPSDVIEYKTGRQIQSKPNLVRHINFRLLPEKPSAEEDLGDLDVVQEAAMGKRTAALGRVGFRPGKRSMAVGRTGFRPGKRSIATGRVGFRPGKRNNPPEVYYMTLGDAGQSLLL